MAQKQFKIGLSNTDKQNMAQDVYERVLALTFNEYDTTTEYEVGDFVVYNNQLYKCIGATSGAWDSSKWQLATLNDLVDDIENAVQFVNDKANVDGNYPTMTVGMADNLTPYDESAGDDQDEPFSFQATGTGNGSQPDFATGSAALMKEKQGNTVVVNQLVGDAYNVPTTTGQSQNCNLGATGLTVGHKYLLAFELTADVDNGNGFNFGYCNTSYQFVTIKSNLLSGSTSKGYKMFIITVDSVSNYLNTQILNDSNGATEVSTDHKSFIDLTQWFGSSGAIPQDILNNPSNFFRYYQGSLAYNEGTLVNANGRYIKCIGMNQWDEEWESGYWNTTTGNFTSRANGICSKRGHDIKVIPNTTYYIKDGVAGVILFYDNYGNYLQQYVERNNGTFTTPSNCYAIRFYLAVAYGSTYNNDISINLYYEDEPRCLTYEPYKVLTNNDTGTETLRSAGSVKDSKAPDGTITRRVGVVDLGTLTWTYNNTYGFWEAIGQVSNRKTADGSTVGNILCSNYGALAWNSVVGGSINGIASPLEANRGFIVRNGSSTTEPSGTLFYELAEPITEQGTSYSENIVIDDFGSMDFGGTNGVPQGANIFYPVDYKAFVDTLYKYTDGTPSNIALKSDVASEQSARESVDTQLLNAVGGTLRQCLCVKESLDFDNTAFVDLGTLNWLYSTLDDTPAFTSGVALADLGTNKKSICSKYSSQDGYQTTNKTYSLMRGENGTIWVIDNSYTDATAFKNAMKGVLIAYEKASE